jgi:hypothetical protein
MAGRMSTTCGVCAGLALAACGGQRGADGAANDDPEELQALLHDEPLTGPAAAPGAGRSAISPPNTLFPREYWQLDDCSPDRAELFSSSSGEGAPARAASSSRSPRTASTPRPR